MVAGEALDDGVLHRVQVLELVHQHVVPPARDLLRHRQVLVQQLAGLHHQVVEVHQAPPRQVLAIAPERLLIVGLELHLPEPVHPEPGEQPATPLLPDAEPAEHAELVVLVGDAEAAADSDPLAVLAQNLDTERVERAALHAAGPITQRLEPLGDFLRGLVGEGDGADPRRVESEPFDEIPDPLDQA